MKAIIILTLATVLLVSMAGKVWRTVWIIRLTFTLHMGSKTTPDSTNECIIDWKKNHFSPGPKIYLFACHSQSYEANLSLIPSPVTIFIFSHFDWICCNRTQGVCVSVCLCVGVCVCVCVCVCHLYSPNGWTDFDETLYKWSWLYLRVSFFAVLENSNLMTS